jgi:hypothetical protein
LARFRTPVSERANFAATSRTFGYRSKIDCDEACAFDASRATNVPMAVVVT